MLVRSSCSDRRFEITLADPGKRNAMGEAMFAALHQRLLVAALAADDRLLLHDGSRGGADVVVIRGEGIADTATPESRGARIVDLMGAPPKVEQAPPPEPIVVIRQVRKTETPIEEIRGGRIIQNKSLD